MLRWIWSAAKARSNQSNHGVDFEIAKFVFDDPLAATRFDPHEDGDRWQTVGMVGNVTLFVAHTWPEIGDGGEQVGRIISARKATAHERKAYEEGDF